MKYIFAGGLWENGDVNAEKEHRVVNIRPHPGPLPRERGAPRTSLQRSLVVVAIPAFAIQIETRLMTGCLSIARKRRTTLPLPGPSVASERRRVGERAGVRSDYPSPSCFGSLWSGCARLCADMLPGNTPNFL